MSTSLPARRPPVPARLHSWKEIAIYLDRSVRTVARWERREHLPVHRLPHHTGNSVYALPSELDAWLARRSHSSLPLWLSRPSARYTLFLSAAALLTISIIRVLWN